MAKIKQLIDFSAFLLNAPTVTIEKLCEDGRLKPVEVNYVGISKVVYRAFINHLWAERDVLLSRYSVAAMEIDESLYNVIDAILAYWGYQPTEIGESQISEIISTTQVTDVEKIINKLYQKPPEDLDQYYSFLKDINDEHNIPQLLDRIEKVGAIVKELDKTIDVRFKKEKEQYDHLTIQTTLNHPSDLG